jgi:hypothetical protein
MFVGVLLFLRKEGNGVITPMTKRVEVVRCVVAIVVAVTVALLDALGYVFRIELAHDLPAHQ